MDTKELLEDIHCTGCFVCHDVCPKHCIKTDTDGYGFSYPSINVDGCIDCKLCINRCPARVHHQEHDVIEGYAAYCKVDSLYDESSSGGIFAGIAASFIDSFEGIVYGAAYLPGEGRVKHRSISSSDEIRSLQGSKYVQSSTADIYTDVLAKLEAGKKVLFSGTPCQVAALKSITPQKMEDNLYTIEIICHGVSNDVFLQKCLRKYLVNNRFPEDLAFRVKDQYEKSAFSLKIKYDDTRIIPATKDAYYKLYVEGKSYRRECYSCEYASAKRVADLTIGDCSTYMDYKDKLDRNKALSTVLVYTEKGHWLWDQFSTCFSSAPLDVEKELKNNAQLNHPTKCPSDIEKVFDDMTELSLDELEDTYLNFNLRAEGSYLVKHLVPLRIRNQIKNLMRK